MSSEDTWNRIHKQYAPIFLVDACALFLIALEIIIGGAMEKSFNNMASEALIALVATLVAWCWPIWSSLFWQIGLHENEIAW